MIILFKEISSNFEKLGLPKYQSSALAVIHSEKEPTALTISQKGNIPYTKVYETLTNLNYMGFIVSSLERPKKYKLTDLNFIVESLIEKQKNNYYEVKKQARTVIKVLN